MVNSIILNENEKPLYTNAQLAKLEQALKAQLATVNEYVGKNYPIFDVGFEVFSLERLTGIITSVVQNAPIDSECIEYYNNIINS